MAMLIVNFGICGFFKEMKNFFNILTFIAPVINELEVMRQNKWKSESDGRLSGSLFTTISIP